MSPYSPATSSDQRSSTRRTLKMVKAVAQVTGGSGGGKPHLALAGGKDPSRLGEALAEARRLLQQSLSS